MARMMDYFDAHPLYLIPLDWLMVACIITVTMAVGAAVEDAPDRLIGTSWKSVIADWEGRFMLAFFFGMPPALLLLTLSADDARTKGLLISTSAVMNLILGIAALAFGINTGRRSARGRFPARMGRS